MLATIDTEVRDELVEQGAQRNEAHTQHLGRLHPATQLCFSPPSHNKTTISDQREKNNCTEIEGTSTHVI